jgi:hypothetical protein
MDATIKRISDADSKNLDDAYQYPHPDPQAPLRFVDLRYSQSQGKFCSATVYDVESCNKNIICDVIEKSNTRSVVNVNPALVDSIPENDHLLYLGSDSGKEPAFIQRNRDRWWGQQTSNSSTFYFSPQAVLPMGYVSSWHTTIAHIFISLKTLSRVRLSLLHFRRDVMSISIQEDRKELCRISTNEITEEPRLQDFELDQFEPGRHELELVPVQTGTFASYFLRDILVEFFNDPPLHSSVDKDGGNLATMVEHGGADAEPSGIEDIDVEKGRNVNITIENDVPSLDS